MRFSIPFSILRNKYNPKQLTGVIPLKIISKGDISFIIEEI
jgi:hypothetical protein